MAKYTQEQLQHYRANPEEIDATDTELVEALASEELPADLRDSEGEPKEGVTDPDDEAAAKAKADADAKIAADKAAEEKARTDAEAKAAETKSGEEEPGKETEGAKVVTRDGKSTIPFKVLDDARQGKQAAEAALAEAQQTILSLAEQLRALKEGKPDPGAAEGEKTADELRELAAQAGEDAPWAKPVLEKLVDAVQAAHEELAELRGEREESEAQVKARLEQAAADALNANPTLVLWQTEAPDLFNEAVEFDRTLRRSPAMAARYPTFDKRFERVVELVKANHQGEGIPLPEPLATDPPASAAKPAEKPSSADAKARAEEELRKAAEKSSITTLSDIPGGGAGEVGTEEALSRMDATQIAEKFGRMSPQDIISWVSSH